MKSKSKVCCIFGHRQITDTKQLRDKLYQTFEELITQNDVCVFLFGSRSEFDSLCREITSELKDKYTHIHRIYIRAEYQFITESYEKKDIRWMSFFLWLG